MRFSSFAVAALTAVLGLACGPDDEPLGPDFSLRVFAGADILIFQGDPAGQASLLASGEVIFHEDISDMVLGDARVVLSADGKEVAVAECATAFDNPPAGASGRETFDIQCAFTNASVSELCSATQAGIQVLVRSNLGNENGPVEELAVQCIEDRNRPDILALTSEGNPADKPCSWVNGNIEQRYGYADGQISFVDDYQSGTLTGRSAFLRNPDGSVAEVVAVDVDGLWFARRSYTYESAVVVSVSSETYPDPAILCSYTFSNGDWNVHCPDSSSVAHWDPSQKTLVRQLDGVDLTLSYSGTLDSPTQWYTEHPADFINVMHPLEDTGVVDGSALLGSYTYDGQGRVTGLTNSVAGQVVETISYDYVCP